MHTVTFYPLGNADTSKIDLPNGRTLLFDYANTRDPDDPTDRRIDLAKQLRAELSKAGRKSFDVVAFTHLDDDHVTGAPDFFHLEHASKYQGDDRIEIDDLWVPAAAIIETGLTGDKRVIQREARYRLEQGKGVRVFSRPALLEKWLRSKGLTVADRKDLIDRFFLVFDSAFESCSVAFDARDSFHLALGQPKANFGNRFAGLQRRVKGILDEFAYHRRWPKVVKCCDPGGREPDSGRIGPEAKIGSPGWLSTFHRVPILGRLGR